MLGAPAPLLETGYGTYLLQTTLALVGVCALAWLVLRLLKRRGLGLSPRGLRVVAELPLEPRRTIYVVEAAGKFLLVGAGEGGLSVLAELDGAEVAKLERDAERPAGLAEIVRRALAGQNQGKK